MTENDLFARRSLGMKMAMVVRQWRAVIDSAVAGTRLAQSSWAVLMRLHQLGDNVSVSEPTEVQGIELSPLMRTLSLLEKQGCSVCFTLLYGKRIRPLTLTIEERAILEKLSCVIETHQERVIQTIPEADLATFSVTLNQIACHLRNIREKDNKIQHVVMTPEQKFACWTRVSIVAFLGIFIWFIVADIQVPLTPDSAMVCVAAPVSSQVSGYVSHAYVYNSSQVGKGNLLYEFDLTPFINRVGAAQIALGQAKLSNQQPNIQITAARTNLHTAQYTTRNDKVTLDRYRCLGTMQNVSQPDLDKVRTTWQTSEQSVSALNIQIQNLLIQYSEHDDKRNITLQGYRNALEEAQLSLAWTQVCAETDSVVSNLQFNPGIYATVVTAVLALVNSNTDIAADLRRKSLRHTTVNADVAVVFDAPPGQVFPAYATSGGAGILARQKAVNSQLSQPGQSIRWVRDAQRMHIYVTLGQPLAKPPPVGVCATVQLYNNEGSFARTFVGLQAHLVSWLHYVY